MRPTRNDQRVGAQFEMSIFGSMECRTLKPLWRMQVRCTPQATRKCENCGARKAKD